jgi:hypothetical protein
MKTALGKKLKELFIAIATEVDASFLLDPAFENDRQFVAVRRQAECGQWQFIALSYSTLANRFFVEAAISTSDSFPINAFPFSHSDPAEEGVLRFRAHSLWSNKNVSGGWLVQKVTDEPATDTIFPPEGIFETPEAAIADVKERMTKWILPYLDSVAGSQRRQ